MIDTDTTQAESSPAPLLSLDDDALIRRYVDANDRDALETLFRRHADTAYATALRVCRNAADAHDAVQSAFINVMQNAAAYRGGSEAAAKVWITRIVVGTCKNRIRTEVRRRKWEELASGELDTICLPEDPSATEEDKALAAAVFQELDVLPDHYRMPILLHHCQGMSLKETAAALSVSENTLHMQLKRGLERLRGSMDARGVSASLASVTAALALLPTDVAPASLLASLSDIAHGAGELADVAAPGAAGPTVPAGVKWAVAAVLLAGAGIAGFLMLPGKPAPPAAAPAQPFYYHWNFSSPGIPREFKVVYGALRHVADEGADKTGALDASNALIRIELPLTNFPFLVSFRATAYAPDSRVQPFYALSRWLPAREAAILMGASQLPTETPSPDGRHGEWHTYNDYYTGRHISRWKEAHFHEVFIQAMEPDGHVTLWLYPRGLLDDLTIRSISPQELPDDRVYVKAIADIPPEKRKGDVPLPNLKRGRAANNAKEVFARFFPDVSAEGRDPAVE